MVPIFCIISDLTITPLAVHPTHTLDCAETPGSYSMKEEMEEIPGIWSTSNQSVKVATEMPTVSPCLTPSSLCLLLPLHCVSSCLTFVWFDTFYNLTLLGPDLLRSTGSG